FLDRRVEVLHRQVPLGGQEGLQDHVLLVRALEAVLAQVGIEELLLFAQLTGGHERTIPYRAASDSPREQRVADPVPLGREHRQTGPAKHLAELRLLEEAERDHALQEPGQSGGARRPNRGLDREPAASREDTRDFVESGLGPIEEMERTRAVD